MAEITGIDEVLVGVQKPQGKELATVPEKIFTPAYWTILYHGSNLGRDEWQGEKRRVLDNDILVNEARGNGLSCVTEEDKKEQTLTSERMGADYNVTRGFSTVPEGKKDEPLEIRIAFPAFHSRTRKLQEARPLYEKKYGGERTKAVLELCDKVHWRINQQHPVVPRGLRLIKLQDYINEQGNRVVSYVPEILKDIYDRELKEVAEKA